MYNDTNTNAMINIIDRKNEKIYKCRKKCMCIIRYVITFIYYNVIVNRFVD